MTSLNHWLMTVVAGIAFTAGAALAQDARFDAADADADGSVTLTELQAVFPDVTAEQFMTADANGDGALDRDEFAALVGG